MDSDAPPNFLSLLVHCIVPQPTLPQISSLALPALPACSKTENSNPTQVTNLPFPPILQDYRIKVHRSHFISFNYEVHY
ncbi:hypothetical protein PVK06_041573 [Gossypium arboreum]|uniref:Uncharacterized protein n=1 Tax=Gossypium arboreum TaxID=29729 RepID=A0ABR0N8K0_GOSAR|nr:hypothetical protein PVK06_041573 [Gossypium arboreum]